jgi:hypothetical protein
VEKDGVLPLEQVLIGGVALDRGVLFHAEHATPDLFLRRYLCRAATMRGEHPFAR